MKLKNRHDSLKREALGIIYERLKEKCPIRCSFGTFGSWIEIYKIGGVYHTKIGTPGEGEHFHSILEDSNLGWIVILADAIDQESFKPEENAK